MNIIFKVFCKIKMFFSIRYNKSLLNFETKQARKSCLIDEDVKIINRNVIIGNNVHIFSNVIIWGDGEVVIEDNVKIGFNTIIYASKEAGVHIGQNTAIAANCYIIDMNHSTQKIIDDNWGKDTSSPVYIGKNVWIGANCVIAKGSKLNDGVIIGAHSFVNIEIPKDGIAVGSPAKLKKFRD